MSSGFIVASISGLALLAASATAVAAPKVVATIAPVHSLAAMVMQGVAEPLLLVGPGASPHEYALRPSEAHALDEADVVIWVGEELERFMSRPIAALATDAALLTLTDVPGVQLYEAREDENWSHDHSHGHGHDTAASHGSHGHHHHDEKGTDPHLWLDPANGEVWAAAIADALATVDPANAATYRRNATEAQQRIEAAEAKIRSALASVREKPYVVFHDGYQYFEKRFGTNAVGSVSLSDAQKPGAAHVQKLRDKMRKEGVVCIFTEPQFEPRLVSTLTEGTGIKVGVLDPIGASVAPGPDLYPTLLLNLARSLRGCVGG